MPSDVETIPVEETPSKPFSPLMLETFLTRKKRTRWAILYVAAVLAVDTLAAMHFRFPFPWDWFHWNSAQLARLFASLHFPGWSYDWILQPEMATFYWFKFLFWFLIPFFYGITQTDWKWFGWRGCTRKDWLFLLILFVVGGLAILLIPYLPVLKNYYVPYADMPGAEKWLVFNRYMLRVASWLLGWELLHRYVLLRRVDNLWPRFGWLLVPLAETLYHLQKPWLEMLGMLVFSLIVTQWARKRKSLLLPLLAHLAIEVMLILFLLLR